MDTADWWNELHDMYCLDPLVKAVYRKHHFDPTSSTSTLSLELYRDLVRALFQEKVRLTKELEAQIRLHPPTAFKLERQPTSSCLQNNPQNHQEWIDELECQNCSGSKTVTQTTECPDGSRREDDIPCPACETDDWSAERQREIAIRWGIYPDGHVSNPTFGEAMQKLLQRIIKLERRVGG
jgi:hypothetical protein